MMSLLSAFLNASVKGEVFSLMGRMNSFQQSGCIIEEKHLAERLKTEKFKKKKMK